MPALTAKERARYGVRLFGNLLATTLLGGVFVGAGAGLAYTIEPAFFSQLTGEVGTDLTALAAFGTLSAVGVLVFVTGLYLVAFTAVTDAVRIGTDRSSLTEATQAEESDSPADSDSESDTEAVPDVAPNAGDDDQSTADSGSEPSDTVEAEAGGGPDSTDPFAEAAASDVDAYDPTDPIDDPHEAQTNPFDEPAGEEPSTAEEWTSKRPPERSGDDEAWREEIEAKLDGDDDTESS